jgi:hypothetical protein
MKQTIESKYNIGNVVKVKPVGLDNYYYTTVRGFFYTDTTLGQTLEIKTDSGIISEEMIACVMAEVNVIEKGVKELKFEGGISGSQEQ